MNNPSLRHRLLLALLGAVSLAWGIAAVNSYLDIHHEASELFDAQLAQSAHVLLGFSSHEMQEQMMMGGVTQIAEDYLLGLDDNPFQYAHKVAYQIWIDPDLLAARSASAPEGRLSGVEQGFSDVIIEDYRWRVYATTHPVHPITIYTGERYDIREELIDAVALKMSLPILISLPLLAVLIWIAVNKALKPLGRISEEIAIREPSNLKPISFKQIPQEIKPLISSMNRLFDRLGQAFENERRFTADASHELRTPLAALKTHAQVALRGANNPAQRQTLEHIVHGVDRATHLVQQLLTLARLDPQSDTETLRGKVDLCNVATRVVTDLAQTAHQRKIDLSLDQPCQGTIRGNTDMLAILLRNLVDNAIRYTPDAGTVSVSVTAIDNGVILAVNDSGPGIPEEDRSKVFERFYRRLGTEKEGVGLGLSIVGRIAELHHARISLDDSALGGLQVSITFRETAMLAKDTEAQ